MDVTDQGPIYLGYRLGHIRGQSRVFRALVYNKSAAVLHMLRPPRRRRGRSSTACEQFPPRRTASEGRHGRLPRRDGKQTTLPLERFFERWIYGSTLPKLKFSYRVDGNEVVLHVEQIGDLFDLPLTLSLQYADKKPVDVLMALSERDTRTARAAGRHRFAASRSTKTTGRSPKW